MHVNIPQMHRAIAKQLGPRAALRYRRHGACRDLSWTDYRRQADWAAQGLIRLGVSPRDHVAILSENRYEWLIADHAALSAAAVTVSLHAPLAPAQVQYQLEHSQTRCVFVSGQEQADKVWAVLDQLPDLEFLISFDPISPSKSLRTLSWEGLKHLGHHAEQADSELEQRASTLMGDDLATIIYTSGTTGNPKGVMLTHANVISTAAETHRISPDFDSRDVLLSWLPYSHVYARVCDHFLTTLGGQTVCLADSVDSLIRDLGEFQPTWLTAVPRFYEKVWSAVESLPEAQRQSQLRAIFGPRIRQLSSGGAPLPRHVCEGFFDAGLSLLEGYGMTESSSVISFNRVNRYRVGTVGPSLDNIDVRIADDGEILTRGPHVMQGYWGDPEATSAAIVDDWLHTGDVGGLDDEGFLTITDRKKDLIITSGGKNIAPSELERLLVSDPFIDQAVVYGDGRPFVTALIVPVFDSLWEAVGANAPSDFHRTESGLLELPEAHAFLVERIAAAMSTVSQPERVKNFLLLARPFQFDANELTTTLKVRRSYVIEKYAEQLAALYES